MRESSPRPPSPPSDFCWGWKAAQVDRAACLLCGRLCFVTCDSLCLLSLLCLFCMLCLVSFIFFSAFSTTCPACPACRAFLLWLRFLVLRLPCLSCTFSGVSLLPSTFSDLSPLATAAVIPHLVASSPSLKLVCKSAGIAQPFLGLDYREPTKNDDDTAI